MQVNIHLFQIRPVFRNNVFGLFTLFEIALVLFDVQFGPSQDLRKVTTRTETWAKRHRNTGRRVASSRQEVADVDGRYYCSQSEDRAR